MKKVSATIFVLMFRILGIIVLFLGIRMIGEGIYNYIDEHNQKDWVSTTAYVVDITSEYSSSSRRNPSRVEYDITYQYEVGGEKYSDILYNRDKALGLGTPVGIKYDPDNPSDSTDILEPSVHNLIVFLVCGLLIGTAGFFLSGAWALIRKIRRKGKPEEEEELPVVSRKPIPEKKTAKVRKPDPERRTVFREEAAPARKERSWLWIRCSRRPARILRTGKHIFL